MPIQRVSAGDGRTIVKTASYDLMATGDNSNGQLGLGSTSGANVLTLFDLNCFESFCDGVSAQCVPTFAVGENTPVTGYIDRNPPECIRGCGYYGSPIALVGTVCDSAHVLDPMLVVSGASYGPFTTGSTPQNYVYFSFEAPRCGSLTFDVCGTTCNVINLDVFTTCQSSQSIGNNGEGICFASVIVTVQPGDVLVIRVNSADVDAHFKLNVFYDDAPLPLSSRTLSNIYCVDRGTLLDEGRPPRCVTASAPTQDRCLATGFCVTSSYDGQLRCERECVALDYSGLSQREKNLKQKKEKKKSCVVFNSSFFLVLVCGDDSGFCSPVEPFGCQPTLALGASCVSMNQCGPSNGDEICYETDAVLAPDACDDAIEVFVGDNGPFHNRMASRQLEEPWNLGVEAPPVGHDVWFRFTSTSTDTINIGTCGESTTFDTAIQVFTGSGCCDLSTRSAAMDDNGCLDARFGTAVVEGLSVVAGQVYMIRVGGADYERGNFRLKIGDPSPSLIGTNGKCGATTTCSTDVVSGVCAYGELCHFIPREDMCLPGPGQRCKQNMCHDDLFCSAALDEKEDVCCTAPCSNDCEVGCDSQVFYIIIIF